MVLRNTFLNHLRCCAGCGISWGSVEWLCKDCHKKLFDCLSPKTRMMSPQLCHTYLFEWSGEDPFLKKIVYSLKGGGLHQAYHFLAQSLIFHSPYFRAGKVFFPSKGIRDHASVLAETVGFQRDLKTEALIKKSDGKQALRTRQKRQKLHFQPSSWEGKRALFVDDIVTTGSTVRAAHRALNQPPEMAVWSLFYRKSL